MILDLILNGFLDAISVLASLLPVASISSDYLAVFDQIQTALGFLQTVFPVTEALALLAFIMFVETSLITFKIGNFLFNKFRGSGG